jgi:DNA-binding NtrC family response regulator
VSKHRILLIEDDQGVRFGMRTYLQAHGFELEEAEDCHSARNAFSTFRPDVVVADYRLPDGNALELLEYFQRVDSTVPLIILTAYGSIELAVEAMRRGAQNFLTKPVELPSLLLEVERVLEQRRACSVSKTAAVPSSPLDPFLGVSEAIKTLAHNAKRIKDADSPILIEGETGVGKGVLARWLHEHGPRHAAPFIDVNCGGLKSEFLEADLFGHVKGAFTGAVATKPGLVEEADGGTLFLDEIGDLAPSIQPKLLKVVEEHRFRSLGGVREKTSNVRLIAATHRSLCRMVAEGAFREDLYYRLHTLPLHVPPLRQRPEDISAIAEYLLGELNIVTRRQAVLLPGALEVMRQYAWPGNIREMRNVLERTILLTEQDRFGARDLVFTPLPVVRNGPDFSGMTLREIERRAVEAVLEEEGGRVSRAAQRLDIPRSTLYQKLKEWKIDPKDFS